MTASRSLSDYYELKAGNTYILISEYIIQDEAAGINLPEEGTEPQVE